MSAEPSASVVVPVRNGAATLDALLAALERQVPLGGIEVVAVDSGSTDGSTEILRRHGVQTLEVAARSFDHGETRNLGARTARSRFVVFLSQDAIPATDDFVASLTGALERDPRLAGAFARQLPRPDADPLARRDLAGWVTAGTEPRTVFLPEHPGFGGLAPAARHRLCAFDNVASCVSRETLLEHPFEPTLFGEDLEWGFRMLHLGFGLAYVPQAVVLHSHRRSARRLFRRNYLGHRLLLRLFGLRTIPDRRHLIRACLGAVASDLGTLGRDGAGPRLWLKAPAQALAASYGQYRGARDQALGRPYPRWARGDAPEACSGEGRT